jgi:hypothetical protein
MGIVRSSLENKNGTQGNRLLAFTVPNETRRIFPYLFVLLIVLLSESVDWTALFQCTAEVTSLFGKRKKV